MPADIYSKLLKMTGGRSVLCWTPGRVDTPLAVARSGGLVVVLEESPEAAAQLMEAANQQTTLAQFQIYLKSPEQIIVESLDYYHLIVLDSAKAMSNTSCIMPLSGRLFQDGILLLDDVESQNAKAAGHELSAAGLDNISSQMPGRRILGLGMKADASIYVYGIQKGQPF